MAIKFNPYISGGPVRDPDMFFGREELLRGILNALHQNSIMLSGEPRIGKTTLLCRLAEELRATDDPEWVFIPAMVDMEGTPQPRFFHLLMESISAASAWISASGWRSAAALLLGLGRPLHRPRFYRPTCAPLIETLAPVVTPRTARLILLIDEMDVINAYDTLVKQQLRRIFMSSQAYNLGAVVAGTQISKAWDRAESPWYNLFNEIQLDPFSPADARCLLIEPVRGVYEWEEAALEFVLARAEGRPLPLAAIWLAGGQPHAGRGPASASTWLT